MYICCVCTQLYTINVTVFYYSLNLLQSKTYRIYIQFMVLQVVGYKGILGSTAPANICQQGTIVVMS